ncbi:rano class II histocompatibility antigen, A beta chain-like isoform X2 [Betta splendens]|uniref:Rano class II histocompatibility antigen, A beta chain-like isoform X2 n=1 Tax=Betta splendens TaxID=158456 RepID=A0A6P7KMA6_BETSP|nr:rano class II histocompatibility antigen, A beta chain-like isoform X2 [Betta splendens]
MCSTHRCLTRFLLLLLFSTAGALYGHAVVHCVFTSTDGHDAVYLEDYYFNKLLIGQYNSSVGKMVGYTEIGKEFADSLNKNQENVKLLQWKTKRCKAEVPLVIKSLLNPVEPYVLLRSVKAATSEHPGVLICSVYNFYPKQINVTWLSDGKEITSGVTSTDEMSNGNWLYQIHSHLEYKPREGEKITCMVEHASFKQPKLVDWETATDPGMIQFALGISGLVSGLVLFIFALIYYKQKKTVRVSVPTTEVLYPEDTL